MQRRLVTGLGVLFAIALVAILLGPSLFEGEPSNGRGGGDREGDEVELDPRLQGKGHVGAANPRTHGTLRGHVTLDGLRAEARITCLETRGAPLPRASGERWRWLLEYAPPTAGSSIETRAGAQGTFVLELAPGTWHVEASFPDGTRGWTVVAVRGGEATIVRLDVRRGAHTVRGRVRWADGRPFDGYVLARWDHEQPSKWTSGGRTLPPVAPCDGEGRFALLPLPPGNLVLHAVSPGEIVVGRRIQVPWPHDLEWVVDATYRTVTGRVVDAATAAPIQDATFREPWGEWLSGTRTVSDGTFTLRTDAKQLVVSAAGYTPRRVFVPPGDQALTVRLAAAARLHGRVLRAGSREPVGGAVVHALPYGVRTASATTATSDEKGAWSMSEAPSGPVSLVVLGGGVCSEGLGDVRPQAADPFRVVIPPAGTLRRDLLVVDSAGLEGRVLEADGRPASGVTLSVASMAGLPLPWSVCERRTPALEGAYAFQDLIPGVPWRVTLERLPQLAHKSLRFLFRPGERLVQDLHLPPFRRAVLEVRDVRTEAPIVDAVLDLEPVLVRADGKGRIVVGDLPVARGDESQIYGVEAPGYAPAWVDPWATDDVQVIRLQPSTGLAGRIEGLPEGASYDQISLRAAIHVWHVLPVAPDGTFRDPSFPDVPDRLFADLTHGNAKYSASALVEPGDEEVVLVLERRPDTRWWAPVTWTIHVKGPDGTPVPHVVHDVLHCASNGCSGSLGFTSQTGSVIAQHGKQEVGFVRLRQARDAAGAPLGYAPVLVGPLGPEGGEVEVRMRPGLAIGGHVLDGDEQPVAGVRIDAHYDAHALPGHRDDTLADEPLVTTYADDAGRFRLSGLAVGTHRLQVRGSGRHVAPRPIEVEAGRQDVILTMVSTHVVELTILDPEGRPVPGAWYRAGRKGGRSTHGEVDGRGLARIVGLDPAEAYRLRVGPPWTQLDVRGVDIPDWRPTSGAIKLRRGAGIVGRLLDGDGQPVPSVPVHLLGGGRRGINYYTDADGTFRFRGLEPGETVGLAAEDASGKLPEQAAMEVEAGATDVVLRYARGPSIVVDVVGLPALEWLAEVGLLDPETGEQVAANAASHAGRAVLTSSVLDPDRLYTVVVGPLDSHPDRLGYREGVHVRDEPWRVEVKRGNLVRARITNPLQRGTRSLNVRVHVGGGIEGMIDPQGRILVPGTPPGRWRLEVKESYTGRVRASTIVEVPGPEVTLELNEPT